MNPKKDPRQKAKEILANCKESERHPGCLIWQGPVDDNGYGYTQFTGKHSLVHRIVALYGIERTAEQVEQLKKFRINWTCGLTICLRLDGAHMHFATSKPEKVWEDPAILDEIVRNAGLVEAWR